MLFNNVDVFDVVLKVIVLGVKAVLCLESKVMASASDAEVRMVILMSFFILLLAL